MSETTVAPASSTRAAKRHATARRLQQCAIRLTAEHGFDGWTMDDLAVAAEVSRRTVFNYFDGKAEVVLGPEPAVDEASADRFLTGGPTGDLFDDLATIARVAITQEIHDPSSMATFREAVMNDPHLLRLVHARFEEFADRLGDGIRQREGADFPEARVRLLLRLLLTCFDDALERVARDPDRAVTTELDAAIADARALLT
ncbi:TetR family transcriptional regulator [Nocardioides sp. GY 10113]|uniref:TetR/AcrR family transcriptional regulator n=1 Tax=Nocardioides sp. GY 10113 TaxID=2569761 RepID=UPI0010A839F2|nr:TetR/AcrR family transcriptional regulator [Nocardioides sp. GY 10113]TIC89148.1 TetR family transcriptional regulator [Nocardioides sp. GY 10113]